MPLSPPPTRFVSRLSCFSTAAANNAHTRTPQDVVGRARQHSHNLSVYRRAAAAQAFAPSRAVSDDEDDDDHDDADERANATRGAPRWAGDESASDSAPRTPV